MDIEEMTTVVLEDPKTDVPKTDKAEKTKDKKSKDKKAAKEKKAKEKKESKDKKSKDKKSKDKKKSKKQIKLPYKRAINLAEHLEKRTNWLLAIPGVILIVLGAGIFSKVAVIDRMNALDEANARVSEMQSQVDLLYQKYDELNVISEEYAHYTYSGLTEEEQQYFNRLELVKLIESRIMTKATVDNYQVKEDELIVPLRADSLEIVKEIVSDLEKDSLVNYCVMNNANTMEATENEEEYVAAQLTIYLNTLEGGDEE